MISAGACSNATIIGVSRVELGAAPTGTRTFTPITSSRRPAEAGTRWGTSVPYAPDATASATGTPTSRGAAAASPAGAHRGRPARRPEVIAVDGDVNEDLRVECVSCEERQPYEREGENVVRCEECGRRHSNESLVPAWGIQP